MPKRGYTICRAQLSVTDGKFVLRAPDRRDYQRTPGQCWVAKFVLMRLTRCSSSPIRNSLWALIDLPERYLEKVKVGQPVSVEVDAYPGETFKGKVTVIGETLDPVTRRIQVRAEIENGSHRLKPEMFARVTPVADNHASMPRIPNTALFSQGLHSYRVR